MAHILDPARTVAVVFGAHDWSRAGQPIAPSFRRSAKHLHAYLLAPRPRGLGLEPDLLLDLFDDPSSADAQLGRIRDTIRSLVLERRQTPHSIQDILIYYVGHGACEDGRHLHLLVRDSSEGIEAQTSINAPDLAQVLRVAAPQQRRIIILDCCFSERAAEAFGAMGPLDEAVAATALRDLAPQSPAPERGTLLLCSSPRNRPSRGQPYAERTLFTGALLSVLAGGTHRASPMLSFADLREDIYDTMLRESDKEPPRPALHQPEQQAGDLTRLPAFPNPAVCEGPFPVPPPPDPPPVRPPPDPPPKPVNRLLLLFAFLAARPYLPIIALGLLALAALGAWFVAPSHPPESASAQPTAENTRKETPSPPDTGSGGLVRPPISLTSPPVSLTNPDSRSLIVTRPIH
ncbi:MAG TPA: caspase family protein [Acetobacteraceae bacterium]|nr:caspase family protein [Acetobacteraceae bacterium]